MSELYRNKYRKESARFSKWNYGSEGAYFITVCTACREPFFGDISDHKMVLSDIGNLAYLFWAEIPNHFSFIQLDAFVVMPNHIHGILIIDKSPVETLQCNVSTTSPRITPSQKTPSCVEPSGASKNQFMSKISPKHGMISTVIRSYKSVVTKHAHKINNDFEWQERYYDHIIRNKKAYERIRNYIAINPANWTNDSLHLTK